MRISDWSSDVCSSDLLTAKAEEIDRIVGLEMGADDYLSKPFNPRELLARVNAILRRRGTEEHPGAPSQENESIEFGPYVLNLSTRTLTRNNEQVPITTGEFSVLKVFARHPKIPLSRDKRSEEHTYELPSLMRISYAVFCLKKKKLKN